MENIQIIYLLGFIVSLIAVVTPIIKLNTSITKLNVTMENLNRIVLQSEEKVNNHETRITLLEIGGK
ncbi:MAG: hypothetical protein PHC75_09590 [Burkholderiales bacterium]|nr:hypothetical protein [Burkholderiales bacterium]